MTSRETIVAWWSKPVVQLAAVLLLYLLIEPFLFGLGRIQFKFLKGDVLLFSALSNLSVLIWVTLSVLLPAFGWRRLAWSRGNGEDSEEIRMGQVVRLLTAVSCICFVWAYAFVGRNFYLDSWHVIDRMLLIGLGAAAIWNPSLLLGFAVLVTVFVGQFAHPITTSWTDKIMVIEAVYLMTFFQFFRLVDPRISWRILLMAVLILVAVYYAATGYAKMNLGGWLSSNVSGNIVLGAYLQNGWLSWMGEETVLKIVEWVNDTGLVTRIVVLGLEVGFLAILWNRRLAIAVLSGAVVMHAGIFALSGILFWKWVFLDLALLAALLFFRRELSPLFGARNGMVGTLFAAFIILVSTRDVALGWFDSGYFERYEFSVQDENGKEAILAPSDFAPYDIRFSQGRFGFLTECEYLVDCFGATTNRQLFFAIEEAAGEVGAFNEVRNTYGKNSYSDRVEERFRRFVRAWAENFPKGESAWVEWVNAPKHISSSTLPDCALPRYGEEAMGRPVRMLVTKKEYLGTMGGTIGFRLCRYGRPL